ncbi:MAG: GntR family transcriptional regulator [Candidatus Wallacebacter cryptica]|nr:GntR family transcriptional regulator [Bacillota bacterium]
MEIVLSNSSGLPLYEQIASQIKNMIISGELKSGEALPSMRYLAKELRISVITTKRAYEELEREGFITTVQGKGSFVSEKNMEIIREEQLRVAEEHLEVAVRAGKQAGISLEELITVLEMFYREGE